MGGGYYLGIGSVVAVEKFKELTGEQRMQAGVQFVNGEDLALLQDIQERGRECKYLLSAL